jgi:hypothetical protein
MLLHLLEERNEAKVLVRMYLDDQKVVRKSAWLRSVNHVEIGRILK